MPEDDQNTHVINRDFEEREAQNLAERFSLSYIDIEKESINTDLLKIIPAESAFNLKIIPFRLTQKDLKVAIVAPNSEPLQNFVRGLQKQFTVEIFICSNTGFTAASKIYSSSLVNLRSVEKRETFKESKGGKMDSAKFKDLEIKIPEIQTEVSINEILLLALETGTSDVHIQPFLDRVKLRFRVNGILHDILEIDRETAQRIVSRIKYDSGTKSNITNIPQDGRMSLNANNRTIDIRVSVIPTETVESITMRILDVRKGLKEFGELGFPQKQVDFIMQVIGEPNGLILMTGPTGSGKTTTLYAMLNELNTPERKIVTLEDPIEYHLPNVTQSQVDSKQEYDFAAGLKAMLRHDPDVILIGEIRENNTAQLALESAQTGHLVFSSLHSNSSIGAISRLRNLGIDNFNISSSINAIFGQRLVRTLCPACCQSIPSNWPSDVQALAQKYNIILPEMQMETVGCEKCAHTGFVGRTTITEVLQFNKELASLITQNKPEHEIKEIMMKEHGFKSLLIDGLEKVIDNTTTLEELLRVISLNEE